jgi:hypothetical protein
VIQACGPRRKALGRGIPDFGEREGASEGVRFRVAGTPTIRHDYDEAGNGNLASPQAG